MSCELIRFRMALKRGVLGEGVSDHFSAAHTLPWWFLDPVRGGKCTR
jgi:hypothetical protein